MFYLFVIQTGSWEPFALQHTLSAVFSVKSNLLQNPNLDCQVTWEWLVAIKLYLECTECIFPFKRQFWLHFVNNSLLNVRVCALLWPIHHSNQPRIKDTHKTKPSFWYIIKIFLLFWVYLIYNEFLLLHLVWGTRETSWQRARVHPEDRTLILIVSWKCTIIGPEAWWWAIGN